MGQLRETEFGKVITDLSRRRHKLSGRSLPAVNPDIGLVIVRTRNEFVGFNEEADDRLRRIALTIDLIVFKIGVAKRI